MTQGLDGETTGYARHVQRLAMEAPDSDRNLGMRPGLGGETSLDGQKRAADPSVSTGQSCRFRSTHAGNSEAL
jgi:hypothetical protein